MLNKKTLGLLAIIFLLAFSLKLYFSLSNKNFSSDEAYFSLRHSQYIKENLLPMTYDGLSYSGREISYPPLFHYLLAFISFLMPLELAAKILPAFLTSLTSIIVFLLSYELTKDSNSSLIAALLSVFIPIFFTRTLNSASPLSLAIPLFLLALYCLIKLREERTYLTYFIFIAVLFPLAHSSSFLLLLTMIIYSMTLLSEGFVVRRTLKEAIIFSSLAILFIQFLIFKDAFLSYGLSIAWQNAPQDVLASYFNDINLAQSIYNVGILSTIFGFLAILLIIFTSRKDSHMLLVSSVLAVLILVFSRLMLPIDGLVFLSIILAVLSSISLSRLSSYLNLSKLAGKKKYFSYSILVLAIFLSFLPSILASRQVMREVPADADIEALAWIRDNLEGDFIMAALPEEGNFIAYLTGKKNLADTYFVLAPDAEKRINDLSRLYQTTSEFEALDITQRNNIEFIFLSEKAKKKYNINDLVYYGSSIKKCFDRRKYEDFGKIYQVRKC